MTTASSESTDLDAALTPVDLELITVAEAIALIQSFPPDDVLPIVQHNVPERWDRITFWLKRKNVDEKAEND